MVYVAPFLLQGPLFTSQGPLDLADGEKCLY